MRARPDSTCPQCGDDNSRPSRWRSRDEKHAHPDKLPRRCTVCDQRFFIEERRPPPRALIAVTGAVLAGVLVLIGFAAFVAADPVAEHDDGGPVFAPTADASLVAPSTLKAAEAGDAHAQFKVGRSLIIDAAGSQEKAFEALKWLHQAAENGSTAAMVQLGRMFQSGIGALQNFDAAAVWIRKAAESGDPEGMLEYGRLYREGVGLEQDLILSYVWFNRAAAKLNMEAVQERDSVRRRLSPEELRTAQKRSGEGFVREAASRASNRAAHRATEN